MHLVKAENHNNVFTGLNYQKVLFFWAFIIFTIIFVIGAQHYILLSFKVAEHNAPAS